MFLYYNNLFSRGNNHILIFFFFFTFWCGHIHSVNDCIKPCYINILIFQCVYVITYFIVHVVCPFSRYEIFYRAVIKQTLCITDIFGTINEMSVTNHYPLCRV